MNWLWFRGSQTSELLAVGSSEVWQRGEVWVVLWEQLT